MKKTLRMMIVLAMVGSYQSITNADEGDTGLVSSDDCACQCLYDGKLSQRSRVDDAQEAQESATGSQAGDT